MQDSIIELINPTSTTPILFSCEHARNALPAGVDLGLDDAMMASHNAFDAHARAMTLACAAKMKAPAILSTYTRLLIDVNRQLGAPNLIRDTIEGLPIPANLHLSDAAVADRVEKYYKPFEEACIAQIERLQKQAQETPIVVSIHTYTRHHESEPKPRPWDVGLLYREDERVSDVFSEYFTVHYPEFCLGFNEPYSMATIPMAGACFYAGQRGLPTFMIEICDDMVTPKHGIEFWSDCIVAALEDIHHRAGL